MMPHYLAPKSDMTAAQATCILDAKNTLSCIGTLKYSFFRGTSIIVFEPRVSKHHIHFSIVNGVATDISSELVYTRASAQIPDLEKISIEVRRNWLGALETFPSKSIASTWLSGMPSIPYKN